MSAPASEVPKTMTNPSKSTKRRNSVIGILILLIAIPFIVAGRMGLAWLAESHKISVPDSILPSVQTLVLHETEVGAGLYYSAIVKELRRAELSFRVPGTVESLQQVNAPQEKIRDLHEGDRFPEGTILAQLDTGDYSRERDIATTRLSSADARLKQANIDHELAKSTFDRITQLAVNQATTATEIDNVKARLMSAEAAIEVAERDVASARISLKQAEENLAYCTLKAPFPETTLAVRSLDNFQRVAPGQQVFVVMDLTSVVIAFGVQDTLLKTIQVGQQVEVTAEATGSTRFVGVIHKIASTADPLTRSYAVEVRIDAPGQLKPGMVAIAHFREARKAALIPLTAVAPIEGTKEAAVYRLVKNHGEERVELVPISIRDVLDNRVAVQLVQPENTGLRDGDEIVTTGVHRLRDGAKVKLFD